MTTTLKIPREWASNTNYSTGLDSGTPTKVDPATPADGYIRGMAAAPQHVNFELNAHSLAARRALACALLQLRYLPIETGITLSDTAESMAAVSVAAGQRALLIKTAQSFLTADQLRANATGVPASITSLVTDAANSGSRILAIGTGGNACTYSDDGGGSWSAGGLIGAAATYIVWNSVKSKFTVLCGTRFRYSADGTAWSAGAAAGFSASALAGGLAVLSSGNTVMCDGGVAAPVFYVSSDAGATASLASGTVPNSASFDESGTVVGNEGAAVYHVGRLSVGTSLQISSSPDGQTWTLGATISPPAGATFASRPRILMCQTTGLLVIAAPVTTAFSTTQLALYASVDGASWLGPLFAYPTPGIAGVAVANGRIFCTRDDLFFASDGCGL